MIDAARDHHPLHDTVTAAGAVAQAVENDFQQVPGPGVELRRIEAGQVSDEDDDVTGIDVGPDLAGRPPGIEQHGDGVADRAQAARREALPDRHLQRREHTALDLCVLRDPIEGLRQESTDGVIRTTSVSPGYVRTELADSIDDLQLREQIHQNMADFAIAPEAVARTIAFAIEQPDDVEIGDIVIRPTRQG